MATQPPIIQVLVCELRDGQRWPVCIAQGGELVSGVMAAASAAKPTMLALKAMLPGLTSLARQILLKELLCGDEEATEADLAPMALATEKVDERPPTEDGF